MVDPSYLINCSPKFLEIITPFLNHGYDISTLHLRIIYDKFTSKNISNFLKICQDLQTNVQDHEVAEICEIAILFQSKKIYETGINFIHNNINSNFYFSYNKIQELKSDQHLLIESDEATIVHHAGDLNELEFDDTYDYVQDEEVCLSDTNNNFINRKSTEVSSSCYQIQIENSLLKCRRYIFIKDKEILFTAKQKDNEIFIGKGNEVHINDSKINKIATITQNNDGYNIVTTEDQEFKIQYIIDNSKKSYSMKVKFIHEGLKINWSPKIPMNREKIRGMYNHQPIQSKKNIFLQNQAKHTTYIFRKMNKKTFEAECHSTVSPLIIFSIAISQIVGPYD